VRCRNCARLVWVLAEVVVLLIVLRIVGVL